eukprot:TRINITY_DN1218_c0_g1_i8.p1 TRINITY_DN1218_c0_g1~~TRINITY_DN1218_c0_g1_i8.p1  ORF type:complete len:219 (+),score=65.73 TRINITY_DN1218_c0_g1_i8:57-713(+)
MMTNGVSGGSGFGAYEPYSRILGDQAQASSYYGPAPASKGPLLFSIPASLPLLDQREKFESDDLFKKLARESEVRFTAGRDRPLHERQVKFHQACREGCIEVAQLASGFSFFLNWSLMDNGYGDPRTAARVDYHKERGKVHFDVPLIVNGVNVRWKGFLNMEKLDGVGSLRFDEDSARIEEMANRERIESYKHAFREWEASQGLPPTQGLNPECVKPE